MSGVRSGGGLVLFSNGSGFMGLGAYFVGKINDTRSSRFWGLRAHHKGKCSQSHGHGKGFGDGRWSKENKINNKHWCITIDHRNYLRHSVVE